jgi:hypothetical protein
MYLGSVHDIDAAAQEVEVMGLADARREGGAGPLGRRVDAQETLFQRAFSPRPAPRGQLLADWLVRAKTSAAIHSHGHSAADTIIAQ